MSLSILIPCRNEENSIEETVKVLQSKIAKFIKDYEIIIINDNSSDNTFKIINKIKSKNKKIIIKNNKNIGLGSTINLGINSATKDFICIFMADLSDSPSDLIRYYKHISKSKLDAIFGSRFIKKNSIVDYPIKKLVFNRIFNLFVKLIFLSKYNDFTNAFKIYRKQTLIELFPFVSENFNIFLEIPLKFIIRKKNYKIISIKWKNRKTGEAKFKIKELGSKYLFTLLYCFFEKILLR